MIGFGSTASIFKSFETVSISMDSYDLGLLTDLSVTEDEITFLSSEAEGGTLSMSARNAELANRIRGAVSEVGNTINMHTYKLLQELVNDTYRSLQSLNMRPAMVVA